MDSTTLVLLFISLLLLLLGVQFLRGKWLLLIAGYNTMSKEKKSKVNERFVGRVAGCLFITSGFLPLILIIMPSAEMIVVILQALLVFIAIFYLNMSKKSKKN